MDVALDGSTPQGGPDVSMDGGTPILPGPAGGDNPPNPPQQQQAQQSPDLQAAINTAVDAKLATARGAWDQELADMRKQAQRDNVLATLGGMIDGNPGDDAKTVQMVSELKGLQLAVHRGEFGSEEHPWQEVLTKAADLAKARTDAILADGGDGSGDLPDMPTNGRGGTRRYDMGVFMSALSKRIRDETQPTLDGLKMSGAPELEYASELLGKSSKKVQQAYAHLAAQTHRGVVVPVPLGALRTDVALAETYASDSAAQREHTFRRDALVQFFRPANVLAAIGVGMPMVSNDLALPRLSASITAAWLAENADITEGGITTTTIRTSPKRLGTYDPISWMLLASADEQFGVQPVVVGEMAAAIQQAKEAAVFGAAIGNGPTGIRGVTGVLSRDIGTTDPVYGDTLTPITEISKGNIPVADGRWVINPDLRQLLSETRRFTTGSQTLLDDTAFREAGSGVSMQGNSPMGYGSAYIGGIAGYPAAVTTHIPIESSGDTYMYFGVWRYIWCVDYSTAFLTIDDISEARKGQTEITVNTYHDIACRLPQAFHVTTHDTTP